MGMVTEMWIVGVGRVIKPSTVPLTAVRSGDHRDQSIADKFSPMNGAHFWVGQLNKTGAFFVRPN
jgi:hypothetical protein